MSVSVYQCSIIERIAYTGGSVALDIDNVDNYNNE